MSARIGTASAVLGAALLGGGTLATASQASATATTATQGTDCTITNWSFFAEANCTGTGVATLNVSCTTGGASDWRFAPADFDVSCPTVNGITGIVESAWIS